MHTKNKYYVINTEYVTVTMAVVTCMEFTVMIMINCARDTSSNWLHTCRILLGTYLSYINWLHT